MTEKQFKVVDNYTISYDGDYFDLQKPSNIRSLVKVANYVVKEKEQFKQLIKKVLETTPMKHKLAIELKNSVRDLYD